MFWTFIAAKDYDADLICRRVSFHFLPLVFRFVWNSDIMRWQILFLTTSFAVFGRAQEPVKIIPQADWSRDGTRPVPEKMERHTDGITSVVIHHTQSPNEVAAFQRAGLVNVQRYHIVERNRGDIAYHYLIGSNGLVFEGRNADFQGDSGTSYDLNGRLLICLLGGFTSQRPEKSALAFALSVLLFIGMAWHYHGEPPATIVSQFNGAGIHRAGWT